MKTPVEFRDPQSATALEVRSLLLELAASASPLAGVAAEADVGTKLPLQAPQAPIVVVRSGPWIAYSDATAINRVRVVSYNQDADLAWDLGSWLHGRLLAHPGTVDVVSFRYDAGPQRERDPQNETPFAAFTIRARMRPRVLENT